MAVICLVTTLCGVVWCGVVWCGVVCCGVVWCGVVWYMQRTTTATYFKMYVVYYSETSFPMYPRTNLEWCVEPSRIKLDGAHRRRLRPIARMLLVSFRKQIQQVRKSTLKKTVVVMPRIVLLFADVFI
jgi:hypothetical protein